MKQYAIIITPSAENDLQKVVLTSEHKGIPGSKRLYFLVLMHVAKKT